MAVAGIADRVGNATREGSIVISLALPVFEQGARYQAHQPHFRSESANLGGMPMESVLELSCPDALLVEVLVESYPFQKRDEHGVVATVTASLPACEGDATSQLNFVVFSEFAMERPHLSDASLR